MLKIPGWILAIAVLNIAVFIILTYPNPNIGIPSFSNNISNATNEVKAQLIRNQSSNQTLNYSYYTSKCINSLVNYTKNIENITNFTTIETRFFNNTDDSINYVKNWSSSFFELTGIGKDILNLNKSVVSVNNFYTNNKRNFTLPIVCDENGNIGNYSSCILTNISNITFYCHNLTEDVSECDLEKLNHDFWEDISYWIIPLPGTLNKTQLFNFTIVSSRNRLEYASLFVNYKRPGIDKNLFNQSKPTMKGDKISITTTLNLTGKIYGGLIVETWFKKKCYKYGLLAQYLY